MSPPLLYPVRRQAAVVASVLHFSRRAPVSRSIRRMLPLAAALIGGPLVAQIPTLPDGGEFQVNTYTPSSQQRSSFAMDAGGAFVVVWESYGSPGGDNDGSVQGQRFASDGSIVGSEFQINTYSTNTQGKPSVAMGPEGDLVVVWESNGSSGGDTSGYSVQGQRYASDGSPVGSGFQVNTYTTSYQQNPSAAIGPTGGFVVVWESDGSLGGDTSVTSVHGQRYAPDGSAVGAQFQANSYTTGVQWKPSVATSPEGDFVVVWESSGSASGDTDQSSIQGQRFASDGSRVGGEFQINSYTTKSQESPSVAVGPTGSFVVVWESDGSSGGDNFSFSVQGQRYDSDGTELGGEFQVNTTAAYQQESPSVAIDRDGDFITVWQSNASAGSDTSDWSVQGQRYASDGTVIGGEFQVNTYTTSFQSEASVAVDADGDFVVVWESFGSSGGDTSGYSVQGQRFRVTAEVGDTIWLDQDLDGLQGLEPGLEGVPVLLRDASNGNVLATAESAPDGSFRFLPKVGREGVSEYYLEFEAPRRYSFTAADIGLDDTIDSDADVIFGTTEDFEILSPGEVLTDLDAGLANGLGDRVWNDLDGNGLQDGGEPGLAGVTVRLRDALGNLLDTQATDVNGRFAFSDLDAGSYYLAFTAPSGYAFTSRDQGSDDALDSDVNPMSGTTPLAAFPVGTLETGWDAGLVASMAQIGDRVWADANGNGIQNGGESGLAGVTVTLRSEVAPPRGADPTTMTDANGYYSFLVDPGFYYLEFTLPAEQAFVAVDQGTNDAVDSDVDPGLGTTIAFEVAAGTTTGGWDAGLEPATIGNRVWMDTSGDGRQQPNEAGVAGVTVRLLDESDSPIASTTTDSAGVYGFLGITTGDYRVEVVLPAGAQFSPRDAGSDDLLDSDVDPTNGRTVVFPYSAGSGNRSWDAGMRFPPLFEDGFESGDTSGWSS